MLNGKTIVILFWFLCFGAHAYGQYKGGSNDGAASAIFCGSDLNGTSLVPISLNAISGNSTVCSNFGDNYSVTLTSGLASNYTWSLPAGGFITGTNNSFSSSQVSAAFASTGGSISVTASNGCSQATASLAITVTACNSSLGGSYDGNSSAIFCGNDLNGTVAPVISLNAIVGDAIACSNFGDNYTVALATGLATTYSWTLPAASSVTGIMSTLSSSQITAALGNTSGSVSVTASNGCTAATATLAVTIGACNSNFGGAGDGYTSGVFCGNDLNGTIAPVITLNAVTGDVVVCSNFGDNYSVSLATGSATTFAWALPSAASTSAIINSFSSSQVSVAFATAGGNVSVTADNGCSSATATLAITVSNCGNVLGGSNDGYASGTYCGNDMNGTVATTIALNPIVGASTNCISLGDNYSVSLSSGTASYYYWSAPSGSGITGIVSSTTVSAASVTFGAASGNLSVIATNGCSSATALLAITLVPCNTTLGGVGDGFSTNSFCGNDLNGTGSAAVVLNAITGPATFCFNYGQNYSVSNTSGLATTYSWSGPSGAVVGSILNSFTTSVATINLANTSGSISVTASNSCGSSTASLAVTGVNCFTALGGDKDGFAVAMANLNLPVTLVDYSAKVLPDGRVEILWSTASEINNSFFSVERSIDGKVFTLLAKKDGAGTSVSAHDYSIIDPTPFAGISYYRLSQTDFDGRQEYLGIASVDVTSQDDFGLEVYPNPAVSKTVTLKFSQDWWSRTAQMTVTDVLGNPVINASFTISPERQLNLQNSLPSGLYLIIIHVNDQKMVKKIVLP